MNIKHPSQVLKPEWIELIRTNAPKAEKEKKLTKKQFELLYSQDWLRTLVPTAYGGKQRPLPEFLETVEGLAWADASTGWTVGLCAIAGWYTAFMDTKASAEIIEDEKSILACCRATSGKAEIVEGGYRISGKWLHASAAADATAIMGSCVVTKNDIPVLDENNKGKVISIAFLKKEYTVLSNWKSMGMIATGSDGFEVKNLFVPSHRAFITGADLKVTGKLYHFPRIQLLEATLAVIVSGITLHFVDQCKDHFVVKTTPEGILLNDDRVVQGDLGRLMRKFDVAREKLFYGVSILWQSCVESKPLYPSVLNKVSAATTTLCQVSREVVNELYPYCGLIVTESDNEMNRVWRDFQTASQHNLLVFGGTTN